MNPLDNRKLDNLSIVINYYRTGSSIDRSWLFEASMQAQILQVVVHKHHAKHSLMVSSGGKSSLENMASRML